MARELNKQEQEQFIENRGAIIKGLCEIEDCFNKNIDYIEIHWEYLAETTNKVLGLALETEEDTELADVYSAMGSDNSEKDIYLSNRDSLLSSLTEIQADFEDLSAEEIRECRKAINNHIENSFKAVLATDEDKANAINNSSVRQLSEKKTEKTNENIER